MKTDTYVKIALGLIIVLILLFMNDTRQKLRDTNNYIDAISDTMKSVKNKDSSTTSSILSISVSNMKMLKKLETQDSMIRRLQDLNKKAVSGVVFNGSTEISAGGETSVASRDTVYQDSFVYIYPQYQYEIDNDWYKGWSISNKDSSFVVLSIINKYDVTIEKKGGKYVGVVTSYNPYSSVKEMRAVNLSMPPPKKFGLGIQAGYGLSTDFKPQPFIGLGVSYNLIRF